MKKILLVLYILMGISFQSYSQTTPGGKIAFPSPQASQLGKFGGNTINHSSGTANISIPVYTVKEGSLSLPISLSYYYTGFKPSEEAGWAGLGWTLSPSVITRSVRGLRDEMNTKGYLANAAAVKSLVDDGTPTYSKYTSLNPVNDANDSQPDMFSFQFEGYSGKFVLDETGTPKIVSNKKLSITKQVTASDPYHSQSNNIITQWTIITEEGTKYVFGNYEFTGGSNSSNNWDPTAWYVSEITNVKGDKITFEYTTPNSAKRRIQLGRTDQWTVFQGGADFQSSIGPSFSTSYSEEIYLTKIKGSGWELVFNSAEYSRVMASGLSTFSRKLNNIQVFNSSTATLIKQFDFTYDTNTSNKLLLLSFGETGLPAHVMEYAHSVPTFVEGNTTQVDYWGYYNGQDNSSLIPGLNSVDLEPRLTQTLYGALTKLTYPTKGYTSVSYEQNDYSYYQTNPVTKTKTIIDETNYWWINNAGTIQRGSNPTLVLSAPTRVDIKVLSGASSPSVCQNINNGNFQSITLNGTYTGDQLLALTNFYPCNQNLNVPGFDVTLDVKVFRQTTSNIVSYGGLRVSNLTDHTDAADTSPPVVRNFTYKNADNPSLSSGILSEETIYQFDYAAQAGNLSIYRSSPFNPAGLSPVYYKDVKESTPIYETAYKFTSHFDQSDIMGKWAFYHENNTTAFFATTSNYSLGEIQRYDIMRQLPKEVQIKDVNGNLKQKINYGYEPFSQNFGVAELYYEFLGKYDVTSSNITKTFNVYYNKAFYIVGGWPRKTSETTINYGSDGAGPVTTSSTYEYATTHLQLSKQRTTQSDGTIEETNLKYPLDYNSGGSTTIQSMITANMVSTPLEQTIVMEKSASDRKVIAANLTTYKSFSGNAVKPALLLPYKKFRFKGMNGSIGTGFVNYTGVSDENASPSYLETLKYTDYDSRGNPLSLLINGGDKVSYLWSYNGQYPVAEIQNADNSAVASALGGTSFQQMADMTDSQAIKAKLDAVRSSLSTSLITSYLYAPLVGITDVIDPAGKNLVYEYDGAERLKNIKDNAGNIRSSYCYNYAGQIVDCGSVSPTGVVQPSTLTLLADVAQTCNFSISSTSTDSIPMMGKSITLSSGCTSGDCAGVTFSWNGLGLSGDGASKTFYAPGSTGKQQYNVTASKSGCAIKKDSVIINIKPGGSYVIANKCYTIGTYGVQLQPESNGLNAALRVYTPSGNANQIFQLTGVDNDSYKILSASTNLVLNPNANTATYPGGSHIEAWINATYQKWYISPWTSGGYQITNKSNPTLVAELGGGSGTNGNSVNFSNNIGGGHQRFDFVEAVCPAGTGAECDFNVSTTTSNSSPVMGSTINLNATCTGSSCIGVTYSWSGLNLNANSGTLVSAIAPGTTGTQQYIVTASRAGCSTTKTATVTLNITAGGSYVLGNKCYTIGTYGVNLQPESNTLNATLKVYTPSGNANQVFQLTGVDGDSYKILSASTNLVLNPNANAINYPGGSHIESWTNASYQKWYITPWVTGGYQISNKSNPTMVAELGGGSGTNGNTVSFSNNIGGGHQRFDFSEVTCPAGTGTDCDFTITAAASNMAPVMGTPFNLTSPCIGSGCSGLTYTWSGLNLNSNSSSVSVNAPGTTGIYSYTVTATKLGCVVKTSTITVNVQAGGTHVLTDGCYTIGTYGVMLQPETNSLNSLLKVYTPSNGSNQIFLLTGVDNDSYKISAITSGFVLNPIGNSAVYPGGVFLSTWANMDYQKWFISPYSSGRYQITSKSNTALSTELGGGSGTNGNVIAFSNNIGGGHQHFAFTPANCSTARVGVEEIFTPPINNAQILIYPNPVSDKLFLEIIDAASLKTLQLFNISGTMVYETDQILDSGIDVSSFTDGVYMIKIAFTNGASATYRIVKQ